MNDTKPNVGNDRLEALRKREAALRLLIAREQTLELKRKQKDRARHAAIVGACLLADLEQYPELKTVFEQSLKRTATGRDLEYLQSKGWRL
jgi:hypothetical protein